MPVDPRCFFADLPDAGPCDGQLVKAHLLPRQRLRREFALGVVLEDGKWRKLKRTEDRYELPYRNLRALIDDPASWVPCCGGPTGIGGHHGDLDGLRLRLSREQLPEAFIWFCEELGLGWYVDRTYPAERRAA